MVWRGFLIACMIISVMVAERDPFLQSRGFCRVRGTILYLVQIYVLNGEKIKKGIICAGFEDSFIMSLYEMRTHFLNL